MSRNFAKYLTRIHKWAGLILGLQIFIWFASGFFMTLFPIDQVRGRHIATAEPVALTDTHIIPIEIAMTAYEGQLTGARLTTLPTGPAYILMGDTGEIVMNAKDGTFISSLDEASVRKVAEQYYMGEAAIASLRKLDAAPREYRGALPVWQVEFADKSNTRIYLDTKTAELKAVRTRLWRVFDVAWRFHIIDITGEDNFNAWWLKLASFLAMLFAISGFGLLWHRFMGRRRLRRLAA
ncbi:PepSY domain-containing protein [Litorimonas sp. RW-G-Af-16]|uniref:PepSY domain-containing protein n=1 Tax=Litorimonas sp. RW-G-Af-16 TaxID=3241168 RepID=UPI00390C7C08